MQYEIIGGNLPAVLCRLTRGEKLICEAGGMSWMDGVFKMETTGGGIGKMFGRMFSGESMFTNTYTAQQDGEIAFASSFPGAIRAVQITPRDQPDSWQEHYRAEKGFSRMRGRR